MLPKTQAWFVIAMCFWPKFFYIAYSIDQFILPCKLNFSLDSGFAESEDVIEVRIIHSHLVVILL